MRALPIVTLCACLGATQIPAARFAPDPAWGPVAYRVDLSRPAPLRPEISQDDRIEDIAFLEHAIAEAWPRITTTPEMAGMMRDRGREVASRATTLAEFCDQLAEAYRFGDVRMSLGDKRCGSSRVRPAEAQRIAAISQGRNYEWHRDTRDAVSVGVLSIARFAPPDDPGWAELPAALRELAAEDFVVIDLQAATGDDPRVGFAVLASLGLEHFQRNPPRSMIARDTPMAEIVRANYVARHPEVHARSREVWRSFDTETAIHTLGHAIAAVERQTPAVHVVFVVGSGCDPACQMIASLAQFQNGVELASVSGVEDKLNGDELGMIRLRHSGVEVTFPTVAYGTAWGGEVLGSYVPGANMMQASLDASHRSAASRAEAAHWNAAELVPCRSLPVDDVALDRKRSGCFQSPPERASLALMLVLGSDRARSWLTSCGVTVGTVLTNATTGETIATVDGAHAAIAQLAHAPFVQVIEWSCPVYPNATKKPE